MRLSVETSVNARPVEASLLEDGSHLFLVRIDREVAECRDELAELDGRLPLLGGIGLRIGRIFGRQKPLRDREWCGRLLVIAAAGDERDDRYRYEDRKGEAQPSPAKSQSHLSPLPVTAAH